MNASHAQAFARDLKIRPGMMATLSGNLAVSVPSDDRMPISVQALGTTGKGGLGPYYVQQFAREQSRTIVQ